MFDETRLERLIAAYFDQELTAEEKRELEEMLLGSSRAREIFQDRCDWHGLAREWGLQSRTERVMADPAAEKKVIPLARRAWMSAAGIAACLALGWWLLPFGKKDPKELVDKPATSGSHVATLGQALDVQWEGTNFSEGSPLPKGWLKIAKGTLRLDFYSGARVILEGPASLELLSPDLARLEKGKLTAKVPPAAQGFAVLNENLKVVDRGTEFGMNVTGEKACEVHVFDGKVELQGDLPASAKKDLREGNGVAIRQGKWEAITANRATFVDPASFLKAGARETEAKWETWRSASQEVRKLPDLKVYFDFEDIVPGDSLLQNKAQDAAAGSHGTVVGCDPLPGRWTRKGALGFARTSDRVRFRAEGGSVPSVTMAAWVRVDSLPQDHNAIFSMAPTQIGEVHWKLDKSGRLLLGLRADKAFAFDSWERLESPRVVTPQDFGRWIHFATVIDGTAGVMKHFVNGKEVASGPMKRRPAVQLGLANLGNFDPAAPEQKDGIIRSFNGRIDEFALFTRALSASEIASLTAK
ncbi:LamG domain-containing protein [Haloferula sp. BvORR071]|uniref:LamG domain-containing protein n=1 Tax=Haloferula sp. BvORR071 TaxID=1396141 RepID=UPI00054EC2CF|nr:LamG domain-containing protein [Haloferula sp. BvORR071]